MITKVFRDLYEYRDRYEQGQPNGGPRYLITGVDNFNYEDYVVALCDSESEVDLIVLEREDSPDQTWVFGPRNSSRNQAHKGTWR